MREQQEEGGGLGLGLGLRTRSEQFLVLGLVLILVLLLPPPPTCCSASPAVSRIAWSPADWRDWSGVPEQSWPATQPQPAARPRLQRLADQPAGPRRAAMPSYGSGQVPRARPPSHQWRWV